MPLKSRLCDIRCAHLTRCRVCLPPPPAGFDNKANKIGARSSVWEEFPPLNFKGELHSPYRQIDRQKTWNPADSRLATLATSTAETRANVQ